MINHLHITGNHNQGGLIVIEELSMCEVGALGGGAIHRLTYTKGVHSFRYFLPECVNHDFLLQPPHAYCRGPPVGP